jgi:hypothetical protein
MRRQKRKTNSDTEIKSPSKFKRYREFIVRTPVKRTLKEKKKV